MHERLSKSNEIEIDEEAVGRCETVLNVTSAEIERANRERLEDLQAISQGYLEMQIELHERVSLFSI